jgi:hypothetical protein
VIVVDTSPYFHSPMLATLDRTDEVLLLCAAFDVPTLKNVRLSLQTLALLSFPKDKISLVLNRFSPKMDIKREEVEAALEVKTRYELPNDRSVPRAVNIGKPVVVVEPAATFSRAMRDLARELCPPVGEGAAPREVVDEPEAQAGEPKLSGFLRMLRGGHRRPLYEPEPEPLVLEPVAAEPEPEEPELPLPAAVVHAVPDEPIELEPAVLAAQAEIVELERAVEPVAAPAPVPSADVGVAFHALIDHLRHLGELANDLGRAVSAEQPAVENIRSASR